jgi:hypothetical protein
MKYKMFIILILGIVICPITYSQNYTNLEYYFNPLKGVILIHSNSGVIVFRTDVFEYSMSYNEMELL